MTLPQLASSPGGDAPNSGRAHRNLSPSLSLSETGTDCHNSPLTTFPTSSLELSSEIDKPSRSHQNPLDSSSPLKKIKLTASTQLRVEEKVLKRAEITRITRKLKSRIGLASFKTKRGWHNLGFDTIANYSNPPSSSSSSSSLSYHSRTINSSPVKSYLDNHDLERPLITHNPGAWTSFSSPLRQDKPSANGSSSNIPSTLASPSQSISGMTSPIFAQNSSSTLMLSPSQAAKLAHFNHRERGPWSSTGGGAEPLLRGKLIDQQRGGQTTTNGNYNGHYNEEEEEEEEEIAKDIKIQKSIQSIGVISSSPPRPLRSPRTPTQKSAHQVHTTTAQNQIASRTHMGIGMGMGTHQRNQEADLLMYLATSPSPRTPRTPIFSSSYNKPSSAGMYGRGGEMVNGDHHHQHQHQHQHHQHRHHRHHNGGLSPSTLPLPRPMSVLVNQEISNPEIQGTFPNGFNFNDYINISTPNERND